MNLPPLDKAELDQVEFKMRDELTAQLGWWMRLLPKPMKLLVGFAARQLRLDNQIAVLELQVKDLSAPKERKQKYG